MGAARPREDLHIACGTAESHDADADSQTDAPDERLLEKMGESQGGPCPLFRLVQLLPFAPHYSLHPGNGRWYYRSHMDDYRAFGGGSVTRFGCWPTWPRPPSNQQRTFSTSSHHGAAICLRRFLKRMS